MKEAEFCFVRKPNFDISHLVVRGHFIIIARLIYRNKADRIYVINEHGCQLETVLISPLLLY